jgi:FKBP-type peptidyl-prolyl cis-trans isomerase
MWKTVLCLAVMVLFSAAVMADDSTKVDPTAKPDPQGQIQKAAGDTVKGEGKAKREQMEEAQQKAYDSIKETVKPKSETPAEAKKTAVDTVKGEGTKPSEAPGQIKKAVGDTTKGEPKGAPGQVKKETGQTSAEGVKAGAQKGTETKMQTTKSGLQITDNVVGTGEVAAAGDQVEVHYTGWLWQNGKKGSKFDSSVDRGVPLAFKLGVGKVIKGWDEGVAGMKVGGKRELIIPPALAYGQRAVGGVIPSNSTLMFEVELVKVTKGQ